MPATGFMPNQLSFNDRDGRQRDVRFSLIVPSYLLIGRDRGRKCLKGMAGTTGLEPAASAVTGQRSNQLNYVPTRQINDVRVPLRDNHYSYRTK
jgi:hypothetical protein